jgi:hypothetical protein
VCRKETLSVLRLMSGYNTVGKGFLIFWFVSVVGKINLYFGQSTPRSVAFKVCVQINTRIVIGQGLSIAKSSVRNDRLIYLPWEVSERWIMEQEHLKSCFQITQVNHNF